MSNQDKLSKALAQRRRGAEARGEKKEWAGIVYYPIFSLSSLRPSAPLRLCVRALFFFFLVGPQSLWAQAAPKLDSVFPLGGQRGTTLDVEVRGTGLEGTHTVWLGPGSKLDSLKSPSASRATLPYTKGPDGVEAHVRKIKGGSRAAVRLVIAPDARVGFHT